MRLTSGSLYVSSRRRAGNITWAIRVERIRGCKNLLSVVEWRNLRCACESCIIV